MSEKHKVNLFVRNLSDDLKKNIVQNMPDTLVELISKIVEINTNLFLCKNDVSG